MSYWPAPPQRSTNDIIRQLRGGQWPTQPSPTTTGMIRDLTGGGERWPPRQATSTEMLQEAEGGGNGGGTPDITSVSPSSGPPGTVITLTGTNLADPQWISFVDSAFHNCPVDTFTATATKITFTVPDMTYQDGPTTPGLAQIGIQWDGTYLEFDDSFTVTPPPVSMGPTTGGYNTLVTVTDTTNSLVMPIWLGWGLSNTAYDQGPVPITIVSAGELTFQSPTPNSGGGPDMYYGFQLYRGTYPDTSNPFGPLLTFTVPGI